MPVLILSSVRQAKLALTLEKGTTEKLKYHLHNPTVCEIPKKLKAYTKSFMIGH